MVLLVNLLLWGVFINNLINAHSVQVEVFTNGKWRQNCFIVYDELKHAILIDPGSNGEGIINRVKKLKLTVLGILNTHGHYDHIGAVDTLKHYYSVPFYLNKLDTKLMQQANLYRIIFEGDKFIKIPNVDIELTSIDVNINILPFNIGVMFTPGHTEGSTCFIISNKLFVGDTLLKNGVGRTDLPGGDLHKLKNSLNLIKKLNPNMIVYPGHGDPFMLKDSVIYEK